MGPAGGELLLLIRTLSQSIYCVSIYPACETLLSRIRGIAKKRRRLYITTIVSVHGLASPDRLRLPERRDADRVLRGRYGDRGIYIPRRRWERAERKQPQGTKKYFCREASSPPPTGAKSSCSMKGRHVAYNGTF